MSESLIGKRVRIAGSFEIIMIGGRYRRTINPILRVYGCLEDRTGRILLCYVDDLKMVGSNDTVILSNPEILEVFENDVLPMVET